MQRQSTPSMATLTDAGNMTIDDAVDILGSYDITPDQKTSKNETAQQARLIKSNFLINIWQRYSTYFLGRPRTGSIPPLHISERNGKRPTDAEIVRVRKKTI